jgi:two-component system, cell cycle response regulator DivK
LVKQDSLTEQKFVAMPAEILIIEDNPLNMELARDLLESRGYLVREAVTALEGIQAIRVRLPDLVLMDIQLPGMDGLAATRILRQDENLKDLIIIALTAHAMKGDEQKVMEAGCNGYMSKPIDTRLFHATIARFLQEKASKSG